MSEEIAVKQTQAITNWDEELANAAKADAAKEKLTSPKIVIPLNGKMMIAGQEAANNSISAVILGSTQVKTYYSSGYDPDDITPPDCYAIAEEEKDLVPADNVIARQHPTCAGCPKNQFGTAEKANGKVGRGKACGDKRRLLVIASNDLKDENSIRAAETYIASVSATSLKGWALFVKGIRDNYQRPAWALITELGVIPIKTWFGWSFKPVSMISNDLLPAIKAKRESGREQLFNGWDKPAEKGPEAPTEHSTKF